MPFEPATRPVPNEPIDMASTVAPPAAAAEADGAADPAADGASEAGATDAGACVTAGACVGAVDAPAELQPASAAMARIGPMIRNLERLGMTMDLAADGVRGGVDPTPE